MRIYSNACQKHGNAIAAFFDFANAFPSVALGWIYLVLHWLDVPLGIKNFVHCLYCGVQTFLKHASRAEFMCAVHSGVLQGCPLASLLFVLAIDPFLCMFYNVVESQSIGVVRACADDIAIVLKTLDDLINVFQIFHEAEVCAGLVLKPKKCFIIPLFSALSDSVVYNIRALLTSSLPAWQDFNIVATAEYLGIWLGPNAASRNWTTPLGKQHDRVNAIASAAPPTALAIGIYNVKAITTLSYPSQFLPPPQTSAK